MIPHELAGAGLHPHPEGGYFRETWRSDVCTVIEYLLVAGTHSAWHRVHGAEEVWSHHRGGRLALHLVSAEGVHDTIELGGAVRSAVVPAGWWQAAEPLDDTWVLMGCVVTPPFTFDRFELGAPDLSSRPELRHLLPST